MCYLCLFLKNLEHNRDVMINDSTKNKLKSDLVNSNVSVKDLLESLILDTAQNLGIETAHKRWVEKTPRHIFFNKYNIQILSYG